MEGLGASGQVEKSFIGWDILGQSRIRGQAGRQVARRHAWRMDGR